MLYCRLVIEVSLPNFLHLFLEVIREPALKELRAHIALSLFHDVLVAELRFDVLDALDVRVGYLAVLGAIALLNFFGPLDAVEFEIKVQYEKRIQEIDECKTLSTLRFQVLGQVKIIVLTLELLVKQLQHVGLAEFYWNVSDHESGLLFNLSVLVDLRVNYSFEIDFVALGPDQNFLLVAGQFSLTTIVFVPVVGD